MGTILANFKGSNSTPLERKSRNKCIYIIATRWIENTNGLGIVSKSGRGGGTFAVILPWNLLLGFQRNLSSI